MKPGEFRIGGTESGAWMIHQVGADHITVTEVRCLPDTIDPREQKGSGQ